jgi:hypothetical protein
MTRFVIFAVCLASLMTWLGIYHPWLLACWLIVAAVGIIFIARQLKHIGREAAE